MASALDLKQESEAYSHIGNKGQRSVSENAQQPVQQVMFATVAHLPNPSDNCGIATDTIHKGTMVRMAAAVAPESGGGLPVHDQEAGDVALAAPDVLTLSYTVMEGHRFAIRRVPAGSFLTSWTMPFAVALRDIAAGEALHNTKLIAALATREAPFEVPSEPNMQEHIAAFDFNTFEPTFVEQIGPPDDEDGLPSHDVRTGDADAAAESVDDFGQRAISSVYPTAPDNATGDDVSSFFSIGSSDGLESKESDRGEGVGPKATRPCFFGFPRPGGRGVGTRNFVLVVPVSSTCGAIARTIARRTRAEARRIGGRTLDGVIALEHTENGAGGPAGGGTGDTVEVGKGGARAPHNIEFVRRALAGFIVHPNAGAVLVLGADDESESLTSEGLKAWMVDKGYPLGHCTVQFQSTRGKSFRGAVEDGVKSITEWVPLVASARREMRPVSDLTLALQCGGSDAFSGVSGNPLAGQLAREVVRRGGAAVLAETDELITAESWVLRSVKDREVARAFVDKVRIFRERLAAHGQTAEANPSGGNLWRGLTGISLKSLGAGMKKPVDVRLDGVLDYAERLQSCGYMFMDSPGNDLESLAGQVATGANVITFTSGNGSVAGNSFVPVIKIVTTTRRFQKLRGDMDINAGLLLDGVPMEKLTQAAFKQLLGVASGNKTAGERAGHYQMQIWRDWPIQSTMSAATSDAAGASQTPFEDAVARMGVDEARLGQPSGDARILVHADSEHAVAAAAGEASAETATGLRQPQPQFKGYPISGPGAYRWMGTARERIGLVIPTSLCSAQTASMIAARLNLELQRDKAVATAEMLDEAGLGRQVSSVGAGYGSSSSQQVDLHAFDRFVALPHTEGCGSGGPQELYYRVIAGHATHPSVVSTLFVEHGCEMAHNDNVRHQMKLISGDETKWGSKVGWTSVQQDGGIEAVSDIARRWFTGIGKLTPEIPVGASGTSSCVAGGATELVAAPIATQLIGLHVDSSLSASQRASIRGFVHQWVTWGGAVVVPETCPLLSPGATPTLRFAEAPSLPRFVSLREDSAVNPHMCSPGVYVMRCPTKHWIEVLTGLGATGCSLLLGVTRRNTVQGHPLVPTVICSVEGPVAGIGRSGERDGLGAVGNPDADVVLPLVNLETSRRGEAIASIVQSVLRGEIVPNTLKQGNTSWQITRGQVCVSV